MRHAAEKQISAYIDRQLNPEETRALEMHFDECESCRAVLFELRETTDLFRAAERLEPSPFLWNRISAGFEQYQPAPRGWRERLKSALPNYRWRPGYAAAALCLFLFTGIAIVKDIKVNSAEQAALAEIDRAYQSLAVQNPDAYNPFSSGYQSDINANPFRSLRTNSRTDGSPAEVPRHR